MKIINNTLYNKDLIIRYNKFYLRNYLKKNFLFMSVITLAFMIYLFIKNEWVYALILLGILFVYLGLTYLIQLMTTKRILKKSPLVDNPVLQTYVFTEDKIEVTGAAQETIDYKDITKAKKAKEFLVLTTTDRKTYIVDLDKFENINDFNTLDAFLRKKLDKRYK